MTDNGGAGAPITCILSTGNIMTPGTGVIRPSALAKSNLELLDSLRSQLRVDPAQSPTPPPPPPPPLRDDDDDGERGVVHYIPSAPVAVPLLEDRAAYDVTVKLFVLSAQATVGELRKALGYVCTVLGVGRVDLVILSLPGITFDGDDDDGEGEGEGKGEAGDGAGAELPERAVEIWRVLEDLHDEGVVGALGIAEFGCNRLMRLLPTTRVKPAVDQINVRDCCVVPKPLILAAKREGIELLTHNDCSEILEPGAAKELLKEAGMQVTGRGVNGRWVVKYTAVVKSRGVVENKGYIASAVIH